MEFTIRFQGVNEGWALWIKNKATGVDGVDAIRASDLNKHYPLSCINHMSEGSRQNPVFTLTEEQARQSCNFLICNHVEVEVSESFLNKYAYRKVERVLKDGNKAVSRAWVIWKLNEELVITDWLNAGAGLNWDSNLYTQDGIIDEQQKLFA